MPALFWPVMWVVSFAAIILFSFVILYGAPFLPTLNKQVPVALRLLQLKKGQTLLELGCGDGRVLIAAAKKGIYSVGYELNPLLFIYSWLRTRKYRKYVRVIWGNYWKKPWPQTDGIFVFLLNPYMQKLDTKITQNCNKPIKLVSFAFELPNRRAVKQESGVFLYIYN